jgi:hypothetical protein
MGKSGLKQNNFGVCLALAWADEPVFRPDLPVSIRIYQFFKSGFSSGFTGLSAHWQVFRPDLPVIIRIYRFFKQCCFLPPSAAGGSPPELSLESSWGPPSGNSRKAASTFGNFPTAADRFGNFPRPAGSFGNFQTMVWTFATSWCLLLPFLLVPGWPWIRLWSEKMLTKFM